MMKEGWRGHWRLTHTCLYVLWRGPEWGFVQLELWPSASSSVRGDSDVDFGWCECWDSPIFGLCLI